MNKNPEENEYCDCCCDCFDENTEHAKIIVNLLNIFALIISLAIIIIGIISIIKIGWLVGLTILLFGIVIVIFALLISLVFKLVMNNQMFLTVISDKFASFFDDIKVVAEKTEFISRNEPCPCGSGKKYKRCCGI